ncbi:hypothetical protein ACOME3_008235 [Neoechinorhynchus agilis]
MDIFKHWVWAQKRLKNCTTNSRLMNHGLVPASTTSSSAASFSIGTASRKTNTIHKPSIPTSQLVTMDLLERRLEETCDKLLSLMQACFTEAIMVFERKICALIGNLANLPDLISSVINEPSSSAPKRSNSEQPNTNAAKISNINHAHGNCMEELDDIYVWILKKANPNL